MVLTRRKRKFLLILALVFFSLITVGVLFYSLGYRIGPGWDVQKTGGIFVQTSVSGAPIFIH